MNIWAVGRNYSEHAKEMNAPLPKEPLIFLKSGQCLSTTTDIVLPKWSTEIHHEIEAAIKIDNQFKVSHIALALDLTARDKQTEAKKQGTPWTLSKSFIGSCPISEWIDAKKIGSFDNIDFNLKIDNQLVQSGQTKTIIFNFNVLINYIKNHFPLTAGDIILTGTPEGVGPIKSGQRLHAELSENNALLLACHWDVK